ncbi:BnaC06g40710D [Brassica napus]|uniref:BnaC06g40710D protein n=1 Tax=Brassica napus TaxID=3708 RepID=A0A078HTB5_BRANA|nr:BnaC06g40710D [Brassica napus]
MRQAHVRRLLAAGVKYPM